MEDVAGLRVAIVAEHASARFGGEAALPLHYFRVLRRRGAEAWLVSHQRTEAELRALFPGDGERLVFIPDRASQKWLWRLGQGLPAKLAEISTGWLSHLLTQIKQRQVLARLVREQGINLVHEPIPVSPRTPSLTYGLGVPVIIGPMNGGMDYPPGFPEMGGGLEKRLVGFGRSCSDLLNRLMPGKRLAHTLLVANRRTLAALPEGCRERAELLVENGVDLALWQPPEAPRADAGGPVRFIFVGRLVGWKAVDILIEAFGLVAGQLRAELHIVGEGAERPRLEALAVQLGLSGAVVFHGFVAQSQCPALLASADAMVLPSLYECGGAVVLEAMAMGLPVIATDWGGPADYLDASCGILVPPANREAFRQGLAAAMLELAGSPDRRRSLARAGRAKVVREFDWERKVDAAIRIYRRALPAKAGAP